MLSGRGTPAVTREYFVQLSEMPESSAKTIPESRDLHDAKPRHARNGVARPSNSASLWRRQNVRRYKTYHHDSWITAEVRSTRPRGARQIQIDPVLSVLARRGIQDLLAAWIALAKIHVSVNIRLSALPRCIGNTR